ncbi:MAG: GNAT family N-acetyltransferase [Candidatus Bathyarchaeia archaeon]
MREFNEKDAPAIVKILTEAFSDEIALGTLTTKQLIEFSKRPVQILVYENEESAIAGFIIMAEESVEYPAQSHLVAVKSAFRRKGIGRQLVRDGIRRAKAIGRKKVKLFTRPWNIGMRKMCAELCFVPEAHLRKDYLNEDLILYSLSYQEEPQLVS